MYRFVLLLPLAAGAPLLRSWHLHWGASREEAGAALPGDEIVPEAIVSTRAADIAAPPSAVWPWIVQMGQDRAGFYSYDWLERLAGAGIHNSDRIVAEWQALEPGDLMRTYRRVPRMEPLGWFVVTVDPERCLVVRSMKSTWSWALVLRPIPQGTRLIARTRSARSGPLQTIFGALTGELMHCVMEIGVLRGIKHRAEGNLPEITG